MNIIDLRYCNSISGEDFRTLPREGVNVKSAYSADDDVSLIFEKNPPTCSRTDDFTYIHYSMLAYRDRDLVCAISIESLDLREMAHSLAQSIRTLQEQYDAKGVVTDAEVVLYGNLLRTKLGAYTYELEEETAERVLMDIMLEVLDLPDEGVVRLDPGEVLHYLMPEEG